MCTFSMEHHILFNAPQNINEYHYIWGSDLREFGLKGFGLARVYWELCILSDMYGHCSSVYIVWFLSL